MISILWLEAVVRALHRAWMADGVIRQSVECALAWISTAGWDPANRYRLVQLIALAAVSACWVAAATAWSKMSAEERLALIEDDDAPPMW